MNELSGIPTLAISRRAEGSVAAAKAPQAAISADFETFLRMLTVQMQNQDPLNPVEASDYAVQLATFSSVEQQVLTNTLLERLLGQSGAGLGQMATWVGMEGRVPGPAMWSGTPIEIWAEPAPGATAASLVIRRENGTEVARFDISPQPGSVLWDGADETGQTVLHGQYRFEVQSFAGDEVLGGTEAQTYTRIIEARTDPGGVTLMTAGGHEVPVVAITALRQP